MYFHPEGVAVARAIAEGAEPVIDLLEFRPCPDPAQRGALLGQIARERGLRGLPCVCVLHPAEYQLTQIDAPEVPAAELRQAVRWRLKEFLTYRAEDAVVDAFEVPAAKGRPGPRMMMAVAAPSRDVQAIVKAIDAADLKLQAIDIAELALRNLAAQVPDQGGGVALIAFGENGGLITVTQGDALYMARTLEFGTAQLQNNLGYADNLVLELQRSLDYYEAQLAARPASRILMAPLKGDREALLARMNEQMGTATYAMELDQLVDLKGEFPLELQAQGLFAVGGALRQAEAAA